MSKRHPLDRGGATWAPARRSAAAARTAGRGVRGCTGLEAADGDNLVSGPDLQREGATAAVDGRVGAIVQRLEQRHGAAAADPDEVGRRGVRPAAR